MEARPHVTPHRWQNIDYRHHGHIYCQMPHTHSSHAVSRSRSRSAARVRSPPKIEMSRPTGRKNRCNGQCGPNISLTTVRTQRYIVNRQSLTSIPGICASCAPNNTVNTASMVNVACASASISVPLIHSRKVLDISMNALELCQLCQSSTLCARAALHSLNRLR